MSQRDLIYGIHAVATGVLCGRRLQRVLLQLGDPSDKRSVLHSLLAPWLGRAATAAGARVVRCERGHLDSLTRNAVHQGIAAEFAPLPPPPELPFGAAPSAIAPVLPFMDPLLVTFDNITDPMNLGAILRSALLLGADGIVLPRSSPELGGTVAKASAGALDVWRAAGRLHAAGSGLPTWLGGAAGAGWTVLGASAAGSAAAAAPKPREVEFATLARAGPTVLVLGAEGAGLRASVLSACTHTVQIGMYTSLIAAGKEVEPPPLGLGFPESLNVSVAAALLLDKLRPHGAAVGSSKG